MKQYLILLCFLSSPLMAHDRVDEPDCKTPSNTGRITSDIESEMYAVELTIYEKCMFDYIREQQTLADVHNTAAEAALQTWNDFLYLLQQR